MKQSLKQLKNRNFASNIEVNMSNNSNPIQSSILPIIDIHPLISRTDPQSVAHQIREACTAFGFFYIAGHGISETLQQDLEHFSKAFFAQPEAIKMKIRMELGGRAWRGYFPVGDELTSGKPDLKEGIYFGTELQEDHPKVQANLPMHGRNLFPDDMPEFRQTVLKYMEALTLLGHQLMEGLSLSLGLEADYFNRRYTSDPLTLFRIFHYPAQDSPSENNPQWGVGEHTDYGVLTILKQDNTGGLQVKSGAQWIEAPPIPNTFVCNIGDMLDRMTGGFYRSTPHRVQNQSNHGRLSYPFFFDPNFDAPIEPVDLSQIHTTVDDKALRWDGQSVHEFKGTYGDYILGKVSKVFPQLTKEVDL